MTVSPTTETAIDRLYGPLRTAKKKRRRPYGLATPNGIPAATPGRTGSDYVVAAGPLADLLEPEIQKLSTELDNPNNRNHLPAGGVELLAQRAADSLRNTTSDAVIRRLYDIRFGKCRTTNTELADALLLAVGRHIEDEPLATFPGGVPAAIEMVEIHFENTGEKHTQLDIRRLAKALLSFARGYVADCTDELPETEDWARRVASHRIKKAREHGQLPALEDDVA